MSDVVLRFAVLVEQLKAAVREHEQGQGMVEYALIIALVAIALVVVVGGLGSGIGNTFSNITTTLNGAL